MKISEELARKNNVTWFDGYIPRKDREKLHGDKGAGIIVLTAFICPYQRDRQRVRSLFTDGQFLEIHVDCLPEVCARRDKKDIYARAKAGIIKEFTGISAPYEAPENPDLTIRSHTEDAVKCAKQVIELLERNNLISIPKRYRSRELLTAERPTDPKNQFSRSAKGQL
jgi:hypothetical protein